MQKKTLDKIQHCIMILNNNNTPDKIRNRKKLPQPNKGHLGEIHSYYSTAFKSWPV